MADPRKKDGKPKARSAAPAVERARIVSGPGELDPKDRAQLMSMISISVPYIDACRAIGLSPARYREWMDEQASPGEEFDAFRAEVWKADGMGVAAQVRILWDGGRTKKGTDGKAEVEVNKTICEQHRFLLARRRPGSFAAAVSAGAKATPDVGDSTDPVERDVADQIMAVLESVGIAIPAAVKASLVGPGE